MTTIQKCNNAIEQHKPDEVYQLERHQLQESKIYNKCPSCVRARKLQGWTKDKMLTEIPNVFYKKQMEIVLLKNGDKLKTIEEYYECPSCGKNNVVQDFVDLWCKKKKQQ